MQGIHAAGEIAKASTTGMIRQRLQRERSPTQLDAVPPTKPVGNFRCVAITVTADAKPRHGTRLLARLSHAPNYAGRRAKWTPSKSTDDDVGMVLHAQLDRPKQPARG